MCCWCYQLLLITEIKVPNLCVLLTDGFRKTSWAVPEYFQVVVSLVVYSKCCGMRIGCRNKTSLVNQKQDSLLLGFLSAQFCCIGTLSASRVYRVHFSWYHFISSSSVVLGRDAISMGFSPHQLLHCLSYFLHLNMESVSSFTLSVWVWKYIYYLSTK